MKDLSNQENICVHIPEIAIFGQGLEIRNETRHESTFSNETRQHSSMTSDCRSMMSEVGGWGTVPCDLSHDACHVTYPPNRQTPLKHYLAAASFAGGKDKFPI